jgi:outer membrane receptor protein involved in Fe transport
MLAMVAAMATAATAVQTEEIELSLQDLMNLKIDVGTLTGMARNKIPVSLTTITSEDIALTPARNINDLIEAYVPGSHWTLHSESGHIGMRGIMSDRNGKFLTLVNGYVMNQNAHDGAMTELENWDLNDVDRIEIIRGPGSVTYGPGAIMGVVNIVTKSAANSGGLKVGATGNSPYRSVGGYASYGKQAGDFQIFSYGSLTRTQGQENAKIYVGTDSVYGYVADSWKAKAQELKDSRAKDGVRAGSFADEPSSYFGDYRAWPQGKFMTDMRYKEFRLMGRFTNSGNTQILSLVPAKTRENGESVDNNQLQMRQALVALENDHKFNDLWKQTTKLSWNDQDFSRWFVRDTNDIDQLRNYSHAFSERHIKAHTMAQLSPTEKYRFALGAEVSHNTIASPWGMEDNFLRLGDDQNMYGGTYADVLAADSITNFKRGIYAPSAKYRADMLAAKKKMPNAPVGTKYDTTSFFLAEGWSTNSYGLLGEANLEFHPLATFLVSGRADKDDHSNWGISPRVAWIGEFSQDNVLKLIWQRSVRMNYMEQAYLENKAGTVSDPEVLNGVEAIHTWQPRSDISLQTSAFYNSFEILGFNRTTFKTSKLGDLKLAGLELEGKYTTPKVTVGFNHSLVQQLEYLLTNDANTKSSGISYSDYRSDIVVSGSSSKSDTVKVNGLAIKNSKGTDSLKTTVTKWTDTTYILGTGNDLNNWSNQATKLYVNYKPIESITLHVDTRVFWGFQGADDGLTALETAVNALPARDSVQKKRSMDAINDIRSKDAYQLDFRLNASAAWRFVPWASVTVFSQNLLGLNGNKRYVYDAGNNTIYASRASWMEEPRTVGVRLDATIPGI